MLSENDNITVLYNFIEIVEYFCHVPYMFMMYMGSYTCEM